MSERLYPARGVWMKPLATIIATRVLGMIAILLVISFLTFALLHLAPGDIVKNLIGNRPTSPETVAAIREQYSLDDPFLVQYWNWLLQALQGNFGTSIRMNAPVTAVIADRVGMTVQLCALAFTFALVTAVPAGVYSAVKAGGFADRSLTSISIIGLSAPPFAIGLILLYLFAYYVPLFPVYGTGNGFLDELHHLVLPGVALAIGLGAIIQRLTRAAVSRELAADYVTFARARGLPENALQRLALRNAAIPIVTAAGLVLTYVVGGMILVETIFALPGLGTLLQESVLFKDIVLVQAITLLVALTIAVIAFVVDLSYMLLDPRIRAKELGR